MNKPKLFDHPMFGQLPVIIVNGVEWFGATEAAKAISFSNPYTAISNHVDSDDLTDQEVIDSLGRPQQKKFTNESGLYSLIFGAAKQGNNQEIKERAKTFKRWVTNEVLPTIRRTGSYNIVVRDSYMIDDPVARATRWIEEKKELIAAQEEIKEKDEVILLNAPKVALYDTAMSAHNNQTMERVSKTLGYGRNKLFQFLRDQKVLRSNNLPYQEYLNRGYFDVRQYSITHTTSGIENKTQTLVTPKGLAFIHKLLLEHGKISATA